MHSFHHAYAEHGINNSTNRQTQFLNATSIIIN
uniref:Uncharacterized protein n=1 Tax=Anguilla anguilla TaxID=7936 RepID=A0A0E9S9P0_ANGAN